MKRPPRATLGLPARATLSFQRRPRFGPGRSFERRMALSKSRVSCVPDGSPMGRGGHHAQGGCRVPWRRKSWTKLPGGCCAFPGAGKPGQNFGGPAGQNPFSNHINTSDPGCPKSAFYLILLFSATLALNCAPGFKPGAQFRAKVAQEN